MNNVMIDIETLGFTPDATILSIGAVKFNETEIGDTFYFELKPDQGRHIDPDTALWWVQQSSAFDDGKVKYDLNSVLYHLAGFLDPEFGSINNHTNFKGQVWANSPVFDLAILRDCYATRAVCAPAGECEVTHSLIDTPWEYWQERDVRTAKAFLTKDERPVSKGQPHNALDDAIHQVELVQQFLAKTGLKL